MSCPFYGHTILGPNVMRNDWLMIENPGSNQCALITDAHSPCWMVVSGQRTPEWSECPRNPRFTLTMEPPTQ